MEMKRKLLYFALIVAAASSIGCKKDSDDDTVIKPSLYGAYFTMPPYGAVGETFTLHAQGDIYASDGSDIAAGDVDFFWYVGDSVKDTVRTYTFSLNEVGDYTVNLSAFSRSSSYYNCSVSKVLSIIDPALGKSLSGTGIEAGDEHISADGIDYYYKSLAGLDWFRNNLAAPSAGLCYEGADVTAKVFGKYYSWTEAQSACPSGWRLPTADEFKALSEAFEGKAGKLMADATFNGNSMWAYNPEVGVDNASGFAAIPSGYVILNGTDKKYSGLNQYAMFWTSSSAENDATMGIYYYLNVNQAGFFTHQGDKESLALSVRCVR